jgi:excisionase family DNA binding protein
MTDETFLTVQQVADLLQVHPRTVRRWIAADKLGAVALPGYGNKPSYRIPQSALDKFISERSRQE